MKHFIIVKFNDEVDKEKIKEPIRDLFSKALKIAGIKNVDIYNSNSDLANRHDMKKLWICLINLKFIESGKKNMENV